MIARLIAAGCLSVLVATVASLLSPMHVVAAVTFTVNSETDAIDAAPGDGFCATASLPDEGVRCTLRAAVMEANAHPSPRMILLPAGTFVVAGLSIHDMVLIGVGAKETILDGNLGGTVLQVSGAVELTDIAVIRGSDSGIVMAASSSLTITRVAVTDNTSASSGGGIQNSTVPRSSLAVVDSLIARNTAPFNGGGIANTGPLTVQNSTFSGNTGGQGGAISSSGSGSSASLVNVTIAGNAATDVGGGLYKDLSGPFTLQNVILAGNTAANCSGSYGSSGGNIDSGSSCGLAGLVVDRSNTDPLLGVLTDNGGPTMTYALLSGSPAIDGGAVSACPATDQRGLPRPQDGDGSGESQCDSGAYELQPATATPTPTPTRTSTPTPLSTLTVTATPSLTVTVTPTTTATAAVVCGPRPPVTVSTSRPSFGRLSAVIAATTLPATPQNWLRRVRFARLENAVVDVHGLTNQRQPFTLELPERPRQVELSITWVTPGPFMAHLIIEDDCGEWRTFVGAGPGAF
jgi:hypothetical protein